MKRKLLLAALCVVGALGFKANAQSWTGNAPAEGTFFLYNVGADKFINNGDPHQRWGTNAYLQADFGMDITLELSNGDYYLDTNVYNNSAHYLATSTWCDGAATPWTFTAVEGQEKTYTISNNGSYLVANDDLDDVEYKASTNDAKSWWKLVTLDDFKAAMRAKPYSATDPMDVSVFIQGRGFVRNDHRNNSWTTTHSGGNWVWIGSWNGGSGDPLYFGNEAWNNTFNVSQEITGLPEGTYEVRCSGFGTNGTTYIYGNTTSQAIQSDNATNRGDSKEAKWQAIHEDNAFAGQSTGTFAVGDGNLTLGVKRETNQGGDWCVYDEFRLFYYGLDLSEFAGALATAVAAAEAIQESTIPAAAYTALSAVVTQYNKTYTTVADYTEAINQINGAVSTYASTAIVANYARYNKVKNAVKAISSTIDISDGETKANAATTSAALDEAVVSVRTALANYLATVTLSQGQTIDLTDALIDNAAPGESGNTDYWTNSGNPSLQYQLFEYYTVPGGTTKQTIATTLPVGSYRLTATAFTRTGYEAKLNAGQANINIVTVDRNTVNDRNQGNNWIAQGHGVTNLVFSLEEATSNLEIGLTAYDSSTDDNWMCWRSFRLVYGDVFEPYTLVEGKMNANVSAAQTQAATTFEAAKTVDNYNALTAAITAAQASKDAYTKLGAAITKIDAALEAATSATASADDYTAIRTAYNNGTIADDAIPAQVKAAYEAVIPVIKSQTDAEADFTFAIQNQSFEYGDMTGWTATASSDTGVRETSNATYAAIGSDGYYLFNTWWQGVPLTQTVEGLPNGEYTLTASVASDGATIYLIANGEHNEGTETGGEYPTKDTFQDATITFLVKDGTATIGAVGGADGTAGEHKDYVEAGYWWYKADNFRLVKNRDLTEEEAFVAATAEDYDALNLAIESHTLGFEAGEYAPYNNVDAVTAVAAAKAIDQTAQNAQGDVQAATNAIANATWTANTAEVNAVYDGSFEADYSGQSGNINPTGWLRVKGAAADGYNVRLMNGSNAGLAATSSGKALFTKQSAYYGYATGYTMPLKANAYYKISFVYGGWGDCKKDGYVSMAAPDGSAVTLSATDLPVDATNADSNTNSWKTYEATFQTGEAGDYVLGLRKKSYDTSGQSQYVYGDIKLLLATAEDLKPALFAEIGEASQINTEANVGTDAFQIPAEAASTLNQARIDAQLVYDNANATVEEVISATNAIKTAVENYKNVEINEPAAGQLFNVVLTSWGWTYDQKAMTFIAGGRTDQGKYNIQYAAKANKNLAQAFTFTKVSGNKYKMSQIDADGEVRYVTDGKTGYGTGDGSGIRTTTDAEKAAAFTIIPTNVDSIYNIYNNVKGGYIGSQDAGVYTVDSHITFNILETRKPSIAINTVEAGYGTIMLPFAVETLPEGVKAFTCAEVDVTILTLVEVTTLEANKPYIIEGSWDDDLTGDAQGTALTYTEGLLTGVYDWTEAPVGSYVLQNQNEKVAFYPVAEGENNQPFISPNHAYLTYEAPGNGAQLRGIFFPEDSEATAIDGLDVLTSGDFDAIYTANGVKVEKLQKGLNIVKKGNKSYKIMVK